MFTLLLAVKPCRDWEAFKTKHLNILVGVLIVRKING